MFAADYVIRYTVVSAKDITEETLFWSKRTNRWPVSSPGGTGSKRSRALSKWSYVPVNLSDKTLGRCATRLFTGFPKR